MQFPAPPTEQLTQSQQRSRRRVFFLCSGVGVILAVVAAYFIPRFAEALQYHRWRIESASMAPTIDSGDTIAEDQKYYLDHPLADGDIIVFHHGDNIIVKRVSALAGETIEGRSGRLFRNGVALDEPYALFATDGHSLDVETFGPITVPSGEVFVTGDSRDKSLDSRSVEEFGPVKVADITGRVKYIARSPDPRRAGHRFY